MSSRRNLLWFVSLAIVWGTAFVAIDVGLATLPPLLFAALRLDVAALLIIGAAVFLGERLTPRTRMDWLSIAAIGGLVVGAHYGLLFVGQSFVSGAVAAIVLSLAPIVTPLFAVRLLPAQQLRGPTIVGLGVGLVGVTVIAISGGSLAGQLVGVALLVGSAISFALGSVLAERFAGTLSLVSLQAWGMAIGAVLLHTASVAHPGEQASTLSSLWTPTAIAAVVYLGAIATAVGFVLYFALLDRIGATELSLVNYAVPLVAALCGWLVLGDSITLATVAGFVLVLVGFACCLADRHWQTGSVPHRSSTGPAAE